MVQHTRFYLILALLCFHSTLLIGLCCDYEHPKKRFAHEIYLGPEIYHVKRTKEGGTRQDGWIYGVRAGYDHIKRYKFYWGFDTLYAKGTLDGKNGGDAHIKSRFTDLEFEGRIGYTLQMKCWPRAGITPFIGVGYAVEKNHFISPSPLPVHFRTQYYYGAAGFLSQVYIKPYFIAGLNFKAKYLYDTRCHVSHDPEYGSLSMLVKDMFNYRVELPFTFWLCDSKWYISVVPFYELRQYGGQANFPFDFLETKLYLSGALIKFNAGW